jgi:hypothetical protein
MTENLQICGLGFIALSIMYYLLVDVFEKSKRFRQSSIIQHELVKEPTRTVIAAKVATPSAPIAVPLAPPLVHEGVYPMYIDCSRHQRIIPPHSNNVLNPATI